jgi:hypothetical protein
LLWFKSTVPDRWAGCSGLSTGAKEDVQGVTMGHGSGSDPPSQGTAGPQQKLCLEFLSKQLEAGFLLLSSIFMEWSGYSGERRRLGLDL